MRKSGEENSPIEAKFAYQLKESGFPVFTREFKIFEDRHFRFDFAWPNLKLLVDLNGNHHLDPTNYTRDCEKYALATIAGWRVLIFSSKMVRNDLAYSLIVKFFEENKESYEKDINRRG